MPKVLISDALDSIAEKILLSNKIKVDVKTNFSEQQLIDQISNYDGLIVRSATKVTNEVIANAKNLKIIGRAGAGVDNIDLKAAKEKNIIVMNTPGGNTNATAEHTLALLLSLSRKIPMADLTTHKGLWAKKKLKGNEIKGKTIGIIGFGNVGKRFAVLLDGVVITAPVINSVVPMCSRYFSPISSSVPKYEPGSPLSAFRNAPPTNREFLQRVPRYPQHQFDRSHRREVRFLVLATIERDQSHP